MVVPSYGLQSVRTFSLLPSRQTPPMYCLFSLTNWFINGPSAGVGTAKLRNADSSVTLRSRFGEWEKRVGSRADSHPGRGYTVCCWGRLGSWVGLVLCR